MKILYLAHADNYHVANWQKQLSKKNITVQCLGFRQNMELIPNAAQFSGFSNTLHWHHFLQLSDQICDFCSELKPDIVFASFAPTYGLAAVRAKLNVPVIVQTWSRDIALPGSIPSIKDKLLVHTAGSYVLNKSDGITTDGVECRTHLVKQRPHLAEKTLATPWGIDLDFFSLDKTQPADIRKHLNIPHNAPVILSVRGLYWYYQPENVLRAIQETLTLNEEVYFIIMGLGHKMTVETEKLLNGLILNNRVRLFADLVSKEQMRDLWAISDFFVSTPIFDGVPESVSEGRAMGSIPILNPIPSNLERVQQDTQGFYTNFENASDLSQTMLKALSEDNQSLNQIRENNFSWSQRFANVNHTIDNLLSFFNEKISNFKRK